MRLDYALYTFALLIFIITALSAVLLIDPIDKCIWVITTAILGMLFVIVGYFVRPPVKTAITSPAAPTPQEPAPTAPVVETPKTEPLTIEAPKTEAPPMVEAPKVGTPLEKQAEPEVPPPPSSEVPAPESPAQVMELTRIRGISAKRAAQLKANGITSVEDLAKASATDLAEKLEVSPKIVKMWIGSAKKLAK